jgi:hypothetical protein
VRTHGFRWHGSVDSIAGWLTGPGDGPMGQSPRVMNSVCVCVYI